MTVETMKQVFEAKLLEVPVKNNSVSIECEKSYSELLDFVLEAKKKKQKSSTEYRRLRKFDVLSIGESRKLIVPLHKSSDIKVYVPNGELFDLLYKVHSETGHGGLHKMHNALKDGYANVTRETILVFLKCCETCVKRRVHPKKGLVVKPIISKEAYGRGQVDLIDMQSCSDGEFKFIFNYQDHLTKFVVLRPLKSKTAVEVAYNLIDVFCMFGAPAILQSDNGREFVNKIIDELKVMWPGLKIVHGKPRHSQSQGSVERANRDVQDILRAWMIDNKCTKWSEGLRFCQLQKNSSFHSGIKQPPFEALFGRKPSVGLSSSNFPSAVLEKINTEDDLFQLVDSIHIENQSEEAPSASSSQEASESEESTNTNLQSERDQIAARQEIIAQKRKIAVDGLKKQAKRMRLESDAKFSTLSQGTNVTIPIPDVDRSKADLRNVIGVIMDVTEDNFYKVGTKSGVISQLYSRNQVMPTATSFINIDEVPELDVALRTVNNEASLHGGQGFVKCSCTTKCTTNRCACRKKGVLCNSKCHNSLTCVNK